MRSRTNSALPARTLLAVLFFLSFAFASSGDWVSPTSYQDPSSDWGSETQAYDELTGTGASWAAGAGSDSSGYLELHLSSGVSSDVLQYYTRSSPTSMDIDIYDGGSWSNVFSGSPTSSSWTNVSYTQQTVTAIRISMSKSTGGATTFYFDEADVWAIEEPPKWSNPAINETDVFSGYAVEHSAQWTDSGGMSYASLEVNGTGESCDTWENVSSVLISGTSNTSSLDWTVPSACEGKTVGWRIWANDSIDTWNVTDTQDYLVKSYGWLNISWATGSELDGSHTVSSPLAVDQHSLIMVNATIFCAGSSGALCGSVYGYPTFNFSSASPDTQINTTPGATPFWYEKGLERTVVGNTGYVTNYGFETGDTTGWSVTNGFQSPSVSGSNKHDGSYGFGAPASSSTTGTPNGLYWSIFQDVSSQNLSVSDELYLTVWIGDYEGPEGCQGGYAYAKVDVGFGDGSVVEVLSTLGRWYPAGGVNLGGAPSCRWQRETAKLNDTKPVGTEVHNITIEIRKGEDSYSRFYPGLYVDSVQFFNGTIPLTNTDNLQINFPRSYQSGYHNTTNHIDYASFFQGASSSESSALPGDYQDMYWSNWTLDDRTASEVYSRYWRATSGAGSWINISFPQQVTLEKVVLWPVDHTDENITYGTLEFSDSSSVTFGALDPFGLIGTEIDFSPRNTTWLRVVVDGYETATSVFRMFNEIDAYGPPVNNISIYRYTQLDGINSYIETYDVSGGVLLHNESISDIRGGDYYTFEGVPTCGYMYDTDQCSLGWFVNASAQPNSLWAVALNSTSSYPGVTENSTSNGYVKLNSKIVMVSRAVYDVTGQAGTHSGGTLIKSSLNDSFSLGTEKTYRVELAATYYGGDTTLQGLESGLNSSWEIGTASDIWYTYASTDYTGGTFQDGWVNWTAASPTVTDGTSITYYYVFNTTANSNGTYGVRFNVTGSVTGEDNSTYIVYLPGNITAPSIVRPAAVSQFESFNLSCGFHCQGSCYSMSITPQYYDDGWTPILTSSGSLIANESSHSCGDLTDEDCNYTWSITGGHGGEYEVRCVSAASNADQNQTDTVKAFINPVQLYFVYIPNKDNVTATNPRFAYYLDTQGTNGIAMELYSGNFVDGNEACIGVSRSVVGESYENYTCEWFSFFAEPVHEDVTLSSLEFSTYAARGEDQSGESGTLPSFYLKFEIYDYDPADESLALVGTAESGAISTTTSTAFTFSASSLNYDLERGHRLKLRPWARASGGTGDGYMEFYIGSSTYPSYMNMTFTTSDTIQVSAEMNPETVFWYSRGNTTLDVYAQYSNGTLLDGGNVTINVTKPGGNWTAASKLTDTGGLASFTYPDDFLAVMNESGVYRTFINVTGDGSSELYSAFFVIDDNTTQMDVTRTIAVVDYEGTGIDARMEELGYWFYQPQFFRSVERWGYRFDKLKYGDLHNLTLLNRYKAIVVPDFWVDDELFQQDDMVWNLLNFTDAGGILEWIGPVKEEFEDEFGVQRVARIPHDPNPGYVSGDRKNWLYVNATNFTVMDDRLNGSLSLWDSGFTMSIYSPVQLPAMRIGGFCGTTYWILSGLTDCQPTIQRDYPKEYIYDVSTAQSLAFVWNTTNSSLGDAGLSLKNYGSGSILFTPLHLSNWIGQVHVASPHPSAYAGSWYSVSINGMWLLFSGLEWEMREKGNVFARYWPYPNKVLFGTLQRTDILDSDDLVEKRTNCSFEFLGGGVDAQNCQSPLTPAGTIQAYVDSDDANNWYNWSGTVETWHQGQSVDASRVDEELDNNEVNYPNTNWRGGGFLGGVYWEDYRYHDVMTVIAFTEGDFRTNSHYSHPDVTSGKLFYHNFTSGKREEGTTLWLSQYDQGIEDPLLTPSFKNFSYSWTFNIVLASSWMFNGMVSEYTHQDPDPSDGDAWCERYQDYNTKTLEIGGWNASLKKTAWSPPEMYEYFHPLRFQVNITDTEKNWQNVTMKVSGPSTLPSSMPLYDRSPFGETGQEFYNVTNSTVIVPLPNDWGENDSLEVWINGENKTAEAEPEVKDLCSGQCSFKYIFFMVPHMSENNVTVMNNDATEGGVYVAISLTPSLNDGVVFGSSDPDTVNMSSVNCAGLKCNVTVSGDTTVNVDIVVRAGTYLKRTGGEETIDTQYWNSSTTEQPAHPAHQIQTSYDYTNKLGDNVTNGSSVVFDSWVAIPPGKVAGEYNNTLYFCATEEGTNNC